MPGYAELHCLSNFSFLTGASHPEELVERAHTLGYAALAITDQCSLAGVVRAHLAAKACGLPLIVGSEVALEDGPRLVLLAEDREGYGNLSELITAGRRRATKGDYRLTRADLACGLPHCTVLWLADDAAGTEDGRWLAELFPARCWLAIELHRRGGDRRRLAHRRALAQATGLPLVAAGGVLMHERARQPLQDVLTAVRLGVPVAEAGLALQPNAERHLRTLADLARFYPAELLAESLAVAARCTFSLDELRYEYPAELVPDGHTPTSHLRALTEQGLRTRWPGGEPAKVRRLVEHELALIAELRYEPYFLTVRDIVRFAKSRGILCQGRGSAANSAVCYCLGITEVDPARMEMLFERFISRERNEPPDIDVDFEHERREEVIQYVYGRYGRHRAALAATVISYRPKSAVRDVGKAMGLDPDQIDRLAKGLAWWDGRAIAPERLREAGLDPDNPQVALVMRLVHALLGFPRHLSQHVGGFVIARDRLSRLVPIENAAMPERTVIQWDKDDLDALGLLKIDCLALGMLTAIHGAFDLVNTWRGFVGHDRGQEAAPTTPCLDSHRGMNAAPITPDPSPGRSAIPGAIPRLPPYRGMNAAPTTPDPSPGRSAIPGAIPRLPPHHGLIADPSRPGGRSYHGTTCTVPAGEPPTARSEPLGLHNVPAEDPAVYAMIQRAETVGVFQIESRAQMAMLPRLKPARFYDLVIEVAIVRPGPIQGDMVHPYLRRRQGIEPVTYPSEEIRDVLGRTLGVPLFQEQVIKVAMVAAGFSPGEADQVRRSMAAWRRRGGLESFQQRLLDGMTARGYTAEFAQQIYRQILGFGEYGFPESHAASFALLVYVSAWLKCHEPAAFFAAMLNSQPLGFYAPAQLVREARRQGVEVRPADVQYSDWDCTLEPAAGRASTPPAVRLGLRLVKGLSRDGAQRLRTAHERAAFASVDDLAHRAGLDRRDLGALAAADALRGLAGHRHDAAWRIAGVLPPLPLFGAATLSVGAPSTARSDDGHGIHRGLEAAPTCLASDDDTELPLLPAPTEGQEIVADYASLGLSLRRHPLALLRRQLHRRGLLPAAAVLQRGHGQRVRTGGLVITRQRPASAHDVTFITLEDESGHVNLVVWKALAERQRAVMLGARLLGVYGEVQREGAVVHVVARRLYDHSVLLGDLAAPSRDFR